MRRFAPLYTLGRFGWRRVIALVVPLAALMLAAFVASAPRPSQVADRPDVRRTSSSSDAVLAAPVEPAGSASVHRAPAGRLRGGTAAAPAPATAADAGGAGLPAPAGAAPGITAVAAAASPLTAAASGASAAPSRPAKRPRGPSALDRLLAPGRFAYHEMVRRLAARHAVEARLVMAIIASESGGDPEAVSPEGAIGLMQLMPDTAERLGVDPWDPEQNVEGAVRYLASLLSSFRSLDLSLVAYNAGPGFAIRYRKGEVELGAETRAFLTRVGKLLHPEKH